ncbi:MAG: VWA domain-containing protein [Acidobacteriota bacterium]|nr:VWA domain-containing protein [Acidobacteriota bacterium]
MTFSHPIWLFFLIPVLVFVRTYATGSRLHIMLRVVGAILLVLALAGPSLKIKRKAGVVVAVVDRSKSMPEDSALRTREALDLVRDDRPADSRLAIVSFGYRPAVEKFPDQADPGELSGQVDEDGSDLKQALDMAMGLIPRDGSGRLLVLSDGLWTGSDPREAAALASARGIALDYRLLDRAGDNLAIERVEAPNQVSAREGFMITAWVRSPDARNAEYELLRDDQVIARGTRALEPGSNRLIFRDMARAPGTQRYRLRIKGAGRDAVKENNTADFLVSVRGPRPTLLVSADADTSLADLMRRGGLEIVVRTPDQLRWNLDELSGYAAMVLEDIPAEKMGDAGMEAIAAWVTETGAGLMTTGGRNAYGTGGWYKSPLDPILPVSMELRQEHRKLNLAIVVVVDRSGSMAMTVPGGQQKMDLANLAASEVVQLLSPVDEFGMIAVDTDPHIAVDLQKVGEKRGGIINRVRSVESMGGGIFVYNGLVAGTRMLENAESATRHIILFADAADAEQPGNYRELLEKTSAAGLTVSVVGLGTDSDADGAFLIDVARRGGGEIYFTEDATALPRIFAQDTFVVARSTFVEGVTAFQLGSGILGLSGFNFSNPPPLGGYNLCYLRDGAELAAVTSDEYKAPVVASWFAGSGRVVSFTGEASGEFTGPLAGWDNVGDFFTSLGRWIAGRDDDLPGGSLLTQEQRGGTVRVTLHLDPERTDDPFKTIPQLNILRGKAGEKPTRENMGLRWESPHSLVAELPLRGDETLLSSLALEGEAVSTLPPVRLPYSPEFAPARSGQGASELEALAALSGGSERTNLGGIWKDLPKRNNLLDLRPWFLGLVLVLLLMEIFERRTGSLKSLAPSIPRVKKKGTVSDTVAAEDTERPSVKPLSAKPIEDKALRKESTNRKPPPESSTSEPEPASGLQSALEKASQRAKQRKR